MTERAEIMAVARGAKRTGNTRCEINIHQKRKVGEVSMGCIDTITAYKFPKQSEYVNRRCKVCFHYDTTKWIMGTVIRDDREEPYETLIKLDDGRVMRAVECQYSFSI